MCCPFPATTVLPAGHEEHAAEPVPPLYVPAAHAVQFSPLPASPKKPAAHLQLLLPSLDTALYGQLVHAIEPVPLLYEPGGHVEQKAEPVVATYVPAGHEEHAAEPVPLLYLPVTQAVQLSPLPASPV